MRLLIGMMIGGFLTVGGAYLYDTRHADAVPGQPVSVQRPLVNWDVVDATWHRLSASAHAQWRRVIANVDPQRAAERPRS